MKRCMIASVFALAVALTGPTTLAITIPTVPIGNPGNPADMRYIGFNHPDGVGSVGYPFRIGKTEITNAQYTALLNAVAAADPYGLYSTDMADSTRGGIVRSGAAGSYSYSVKPPALSGSYTYSDKPVVFVSSGDAMRFANWLHNGQPSGAEDTSTTEDGAYTLNGATTNAALAAVTRNAAARWWLPNENEWYKAAYHKNDGVTGNYWSFPTGTNSTPNNNSPRFDTGNSANFSNGGYTTGNVNFPLTDAGAYMRSDSPYGTFDQGGNAWEWNERMFYVASLGRGVRGSSWDNAWTFLRASDWGYFSPANEGPHFGFRVASIPEPATGLLVGLTIAGGLLCAPRGSYVLNFSMSRFHRQRFTVR
jgi:formylglycine-generating enzyme required for sulfatase activity